jgi:uncharacterized SAM-binding protein YcdF (DUF218 family)
MIVTGGTGRGDTTSEAAVSQRYVVQHGVPVQAVLLETEGRTTSESMAGVSALMGSQGRRDVLLVSDPFHMRRARWTNRNVLGKGAEILMAPVPFDQIPFKQQWWRDRASQAYVKDEYKKFFYYLLRYQLAWGPAKDWLAAFDQE